MTPAANARIRAGLDLSEAASRARVCVSYLRRVEKSGDCSYALAMRLARLYRCSANVFLYSTKGSETPTTSNRLKDTFRQNEQIPLRIERHQSQENQADSKTPDLRQEDRAA